MSLSLLIEIGGIREIETRATKTMQIKIGQEHENR